MTHNPISVSLPSSFNTLLRKAKCAANSFDTYIIISKKANTLLADHLFSPALFLAERIERGLLTVRGQTGK